MFFLPSCKWSLIGDGVFIILTHRKDVNILMMYAMCNLHDVSWGTKGDNGAAKDLGGAKKVTGKDGSDMFEVELPTAREDVDSVWAASRSALRQKPIEEKEHRDAATKGADRDRAWVRRAFWRYHFRPDQVMVMQRTNTLLAWIGTNMLMILVFTSPAFTDVCSDTLYNRYINLMILVGTVGTAELQPSRQQRVQSLPFLPILCVVSIYYGHPTMPHTHNIS